MNNHKVNLFLNSLGFIKRRNWNDSIQKDEIHLDLRAVTGEGMEMFIQAFAAIK